MQPALQLSTAGENVTVGRLHSLAFQGELTVADKVRANLGAQSQATWSRASRPGHRSPERSWWSWRCAERARRNRAAAGPLGHLNLEVPGLPIARASQLTGQAGLAEGRLTGRVALSGTPARPQLTGKVSIRDVTSSRRGWARPTFRGRELQRRAGEPGPRPSGGGNFLAHLKVDADLGARTLLSRGAASVLDGRLSGDLRARQLDLAFLSGLFPTSGARGHAGG